VLHNLDIIVRVTADCPLCDPELIDKMVEKFLSYDSIDYLSNTIIRTYPRGFDVEVFRFKALKRTHEYANRSYQREHVTPYMHESLNCIPYLSDDNNSCFRVTVDTREDFELVKEIFVRLKQHQFIKHTDVINLLKEYPKLAFINKSVSQKDTIVLK